MPTPAFVQIADSNSDPSPATSFAVTLGSNTTSGNLIVVAFWGGTTPVGVSDNKGNTYHLINQSIPGTVRASFAYYAYNITGGATTITVTSSASDFITAMCAEYSGIQSSSDPLDGQNVATGSGTSLNSGSITTTASNDLVVGFYNSGNSNGISITDGNTSRDNIGFGSWVLGDQVLSSASSFAATATANNGAWVCQVAAFKAAGAAPTVSKVYPTDVIFYGIT